MTPILFPLACLALGSALVLVCVPVARAVWS